MKFRLTFEADINPKDCTLEELRDRLYEAFYNVIQKDLLHDDMKLIDWKVGVDCVDPTQIARIKLDLKRKEDDTKVNIAYKKIKDPKD